MSKIFYSFLLVFCFFATVSAAVGQDSNLPSFSQSRENWRRKAEAKNVLPEILNKAGADAIRNITESEQVFCYQITTPPKGYQGYTIDGYAISAFCGIINKEIKDMIVAELFMNADNVNFNTSEDCVIQPRIMLRFVRGIDNTDILLSTPCYSFVAFYAGHIYPFNAAPAEAVINAIVDPLQRNRAEFISPALMNQLLPIGVAQTTEQKALLERNRGKTADAPVKNWNTPEKNTSVPTTGAKRGWNKLNLNM